MFSGMITSLSMYPVYIFTVMQCSLVVVRPCQWRLPPARPAPPARCNKLCKVAPQATVTIPALLLQLFYFITPLSYQYEARRSYRLYLDVTETAIFIANFILFEKSIIAQQDFKKFMKSFRIKIISGWINKIIFENYYKIILLKEF